MERNAVLVQLDDYNNLEKFRTIQNLVNKVLTSGSKLNYF